MAQNQASLAILNSERPATMEAAFDWFFYLPAARKRAVLKTLRVLMVAGMTNRGPADALLMLFHAARSR